MARYPTIRFTRLTLQIALLLVGINQCSRCAGAEQASQEMTSAESEEFPSGVADRLHEIAFIHNANGIDSLDLRSGRLRWRSSSASAPLVLAEGGLELVAAKFESGKLFLIAIDTTAGTVKQSWDTLADNFVSPQTCEMTADVTGSVLRVVWRVHTSYKGGANPSRAMVERAHVDATSSVEINLKTGAILKQEQANSEKINNRHEWPNDIRSTAFGGQVYSITAEYGKTEQAAISLVARDQTSGHVLWKYPLSVTANVGPLQRQ
jgi:hypothetical protein